jgi:cyanophycinase
MQKGVDHFTRLGVAVTAVPVTNHDTAQNHAFASTIRQANFVYLSGGNPGYLHESLDNTPVWDAILSVHQRGGVVAGCSAGAMIMGERIAGPGGNRAGFNLLPGAIIMPHFDEFPGMVSRIMRMLTDRSLTMIGIDGRTALVVENGRFEVLGQKQVTFFTKNGTQKFSQGILPAGL